MTDLPVEHVQDYPRPPRLEPVPHRLRIELGGGVVAETQAGLRVLETHHAPTYYLPMADIRADLEPSEGRSFCEWKGVARYVDVVLNGTRAHRAAWIYDAPNPPFCVIAGHVAFYSGLMDVCYVGTTRVTPQPGDFYGGWVTPNLSGQIKGAPGTRHW